MAINFNNLVKRYKQQFSDSYRKLSDFSNDYREQVEYNKKYPFFNKTNTPRIWSGDVVKEFKNRGVFEGIHGLSNPVLMNPYILPLAEPVISGARVRNYKSGSPFPLVNRILGQRDTNTTVNSKSIPYLLSGIKSTVMKKTNAKL